MLSALVEKAARYRADEQSGRSKIAKPKEGYMVLMTGFIIFMAILLLVPIIHDESEYQRMKKEDEEWKKK